MTDEIDEVEIPEFPGLDLELQKEHDNDPRNFAYESIAVGGPLPDEFSADDGYITNQGNIDSCVGHGVGGAKSEQEKKELSRRDLWAHCKEEQGYQGYGTTLNIAMKKVVSPGICDYGMIDESVDVDRVKYMTVTRTEDIVRSERLNRGGSFWFIRPNNLELIKEALYNNKGASLPTSMPWFKEYNRPVNGFLPKGVTPSQGHCIRFAGWHLERFDGVLEEVWKFKNSFGKKWGKNGYFFIRRKDLESFNFGNYYVLVDMERDIAELAAQYSGNLVKTFDSNKVYLIKGEYKHHIEDELAYWLCTAVELRDVKTIPNQDLDMFMDGVQIKKTDASEQVLRVVRNMGKLYESNPEYAKRLFKF